MKNLLITGASSGVGLSLAKYFAPSFRVLACARRTESMNQNLANLPNVVISTLDLENSNQISSVFKNLESKYGPISYLINNAGRMDKGDLLEISETELRRAFLVNCWAPLELMRLALPGMKARNFGRIINLTSGAPLNCFPRFGAYSASKAALNAFTVTAAKECASQNIKINLMSPGPARTEMNPDSELSPEACHPTTHYLINLQEDGPTGEFFWLGHQVPLAPDLKGVDWLKGIPAPSMRKIL